MDEVLRHPKRAGPRFRRAMEDATDEVTLAREAAPPAGRANRSGSSCRFIYTKTSNRDPVGDLKKLATADVGFHHRIPYRQQRQHSSDTPPAPSSPRDAPSAHHTAAHPLCEVQAAPALAASPPLAQQPPLGGAPSHRTLATCIRAATLTTGDREDECCRDTHHGRQGMFTLTPLSSGLLTRRQTTRSHKPRYTQHAYALSPFFARQTVWGDSSYFSCAPIAALLMPIELTLLLR